MARQPRAVLIGIKEQLSAAVRERLVESCEREVAMHERSLVGQADTLKQIQSNFDPMGSGAQMLPVAAGEPAAGGTLSEITAVLKELLAQELHMGIEQIDEDTQFIDLGMDSITGVTWIRKVNEKYETSIAATKVYSYPTLNRLSSYVREEIAKAGGPPAIAAPASASDSVTAAGTVAPATEKSAARFSPQRRAKLISWDNEQTSRIDTSTVGNGRAPHSAAQGLQPIAVIGMAGQFPKAATLEQFWDNIAQGRNCISEVPRERWDIDAYFREGEPQPGKTNARWMGLLDDYDRFDPLFFDISPREALSMDPQQRLFLQACWHAIENAGYSTKSLSASKCGVFAGCGPSDYHLLSRDLQISAMGFTGGDTSILAARVSYLLDLQGPCLSIETACSSSLVAIAAACDSLVAGNSDMALAGGVSVTAGPDLHIRTAQMGMLSKSGRCFTFDQRADGFVPGEGVGVLVLKRLADAERDEDVILGLIHGWGINQDGKTNGLTAPNPESQARLQQDVYDRYGIDPAGIQLIEAHGTGTKLGDPIEVDALKQSFAKYTQRKSYCALGSVKSNIGHCFTAAGVVSTIKVLLALKHRQLPPTINFERLNEHIDLSDSPFHVNTRLQDWELNGADRRRAAINSFGYGGTNAHIVVAEYASAREPAKPVFPLTENGNIIVPLSAKTPRQLQRKALDLLELIRREGHGVELASLAYTLQVARDAMEERVGFLTGSIAELSRQLQSFIAEEPEGESFYAGQVSRDKESLGLLRQDADVRRVILDKWISERRLSKLLRLWVKGLDLDWNRLYGERKPRRSTLPGYPFAKDRYWADAALTARAVKVDGATAAILHPLLHRNTSTLSEHRYTSTFTGEEPFLKEDSSSGAHVLFATACIEMARAAVLDAASDSSQTAHVELRDIRWAYPVTIDGATDVMVSLSTADEGQIDFDIYTGSAGQETVHCQGCVDLNAASAPTQLDLSRLGENNGPHQSLVRFKLSVSAGPQRSEPVLPPDLIESALSAWAAASEQWSAVSLQSMQVRAACAHEMAALVREIPVVRPEEPCTVLDIDICDLQGHVCVQIRGLTVQTTAGAVRQIRAPAVASAGSTPVPPPAAEPPRVISQRELQQQLTASLAKALYLQASDIKPDKPFVELGLDSILGVEWVGEINKIHDLRIAATRVYDYPNIIALASFLEDELRKKPAVLAGAQPVPTSLPAPRPASTVAALQRRAHSHREPLQRPGTGRIAIIGMSGRYPQARNLRELWQNLAQGRNSITEIPPSRWDVSRYYDPDRTKPGKIYCKWMGMLEDVDRFDPLFFKISPADAKTMDPQHRLFLEESYKTFEDAGYSGRMLSNQKCGVYLGIIGNEYSRIVSRNSPATVDITGNNYAIGAARVAYFLNLKGPAITVDTACSSSLVAIHLACQGLLSRETDMALAGGVTVFLEPETYMGMCQAGMLSPDGQCKTLDNSANGFVPGEGVGAVLLKRLEDAERDGDFIYGVIVGSGINQDGKTNGITAPSANSQMALERDLYSKHQVHPETISYVEMHGTGTKLGDPIELEALSTVFKEKTQKRNYCALGAVKSNIGHTSGAAGVVGVQKVLLCMQHQTLVPTLNVTKENSLFDFESSPFYISREKRAWEAAPGALRRAGVSSFGFSGTNAHLILEEYPATEHSPAAQPPPGDLAILLSARTADQVRQKAVDLLDFIRSRESPASKDLTAMAYTLMTGRDVLDERLGLVVCSLEELAEKLDAFVRGQQDIPGACRGKVERDAEGMPLVSQEEDIEQLKQQCIAARELSKLVALWARGLELHWRELYGDVKPRRVGLPQYPFARHRFWVEEKLVLHSSNAALPAARLHPLLHSNSSVLGEQSYSSTFTGDEFFLVPHHTPGRSTEKVFPAAAYLEMARAAVEKALPDSHGNPNLQSIVWGRPLIAASNRQVNIALFKRSDAQVDFEIYSLGGESQSPADEIVHCQGHAVVHGQNGRARIDIHRLMQQMGHGRIEAPVLLRGSGVDFARDCAEVETIYQGDAQLLLQLHLTSAVEATLRDFRLHPLLLDGALQCAAALIGDSSRRAANLSLPHAVASVRIDAPCTKQMFAWVRYTQGSGAADSSIKLDIDLCDVEGNVCVQMHSVAYEEMLQRSVELKAPQSPVFAPFAHSAAAKPTEISLS
jgi:polyketide synthase PksN